MQMYDRDIARVLALAAAIAGDDDLKVIPSEAPETPELSGGLTPYRAPDYSAYWDYVNNKPIRWKN